MTKRFLLFFVIVLTAHPGRAQDWFDQAKLLEDIETLSSDEYEGRNAGTAGGAKARAYLKNRFDSLGLAECGDFMEQTFPIGGGRDGVNLLGRIEGTDSPDRSIVLSAHYDHLGVRGGEIYNGADDNASGTAALIAIASYFINHPPRHSLIIAAFDAEETGLSGARAFLENPCIPITSISLNINMDMISRSEAKELYAVGLQYYPYLKEFVLGIDSDRDFTLLFGHDAPNSGSDDWTMASDHGPFHAQGIPFVYFGVEDHGGYHQPSDDFEYITQDFYVSVVEGIIDFVKRLDENLGEIDQLRLE
ncbi:MAG: M20/M25/M40 family metallo-hydrolase [Rhodothermia bacterium]|nr:MAG: M20/M25/M40 family metallo-hydrolase [Rhodothermia bacterium]